VCVRGEWDHYSLSRKKNCTPHSLDSCLTHPGRIWIDAHQSRACWRGRPHNLTWSVCTHRRRLPTIVASERFVSVWATGRRSRLAVAWEYPLVSVKRMRHALPVWPPWVSPCRTRSMVRRPPHIYSDCHQRQWWISTILQWSPPSWQSPIRKLPTPFQKRPPDPVTQNKFRTVMIQRYMYKISQVDGPYYTKFCCWIIYCG